MKKTINFMGEFNDICKIYAEALENETGMPVENLHQVFDYDSYELKYDSKDDKIVLVIKNARVQFEMEDTDIHLLNYGDDQGWFIGYTCCEKN